MPDEMQEVLHMDQRRQIRTQAFINHRILEKAVRTEAYMQCVWYYGAVLR